MYNKGTFIVPYHTPKIFFFYTHSSSTYIASSSTTRVIGTGEWTVEN